MQIVVVALALTSALGFQATVPTASSRTAPLKADFSGEIGAQPPLGCWDPLGLLVDADQEYFDRLRYVEIKHGRIAMLAVTGQIVTKAGIRFPGALDYSGTKFTDIPTGFGAFEKISFNGLAQIILFIGGMELFALKDNAWGSPGPGEFPGDFRNGALDFGWDKFSPETKLRKRSIELNNGRAAMMGILGLMVHEQLGVSIWPGGI